MRTGRTAKAASAREKARKVMMEPIVKLENVYYRYAAYDDEQDGPAAALNGIDLALEGGKFVAVIGHNGSGKSTLAKHLNALLLPTEGTVLVCGMDTQDAGKLWNIRQSAGMVFQNPDNQLVSSVVEEDVAFGPENLGVPREEIRRRVDEALADVAMSDYAQHAPHMLSGGQKQRIAIAGIIAMRPKIIVMDEPTAMLDPSGRREVMETILKLKREEGITVILITHFMEEAVLADEVVVMDQGKIVDRGQPREVFSKVEQLKAIGLDVPPMTELAKLLEDGGLKLSRQMITIEEMAEALCQLLQKK
jgi:energy-coupling factor transport system ATP-binding protein